MSNELPGTTDYHILGDGKTTCVFCGDGLELVHEFPFHRPCFPPDRLASLCSECHSLHLYPPGEMFIINYILERTQNPNRALIKKKLGQLVVMAGCPMCRSDDEVDVKIYDIYLPN